MFARICLISKLVGSLYLALLNESWLLWRTKQPPPKLFLLQSKASLNFKICTLKLGTGCGGRHGEVVELKQLVCILVVLHAIMCEVTVTPWPVCPQGHGSEKLESLALTCTLCCSLSHHIHWNSKHIIIHGWKEHPCEMCKSCGILLFPVKSERTSIHFTPHRNILKLN